MTTFVIRGEPAVKREERRCADEITFVEVASTVVPAGSRQSDPIGRMGGGEREEGKGWMSMPHRRRRRHPTLLVREIARYTSRQAASRPLFHSPDARVENHGYHDRIGMGGGEQGFPSDGCALSL